MASASEMLRGELAIARLGKPRMGWAGACPAARLVAWSSLRCSALVALSSAVYERSGRGSGRAPIGWLPFEGASLSGRTAAVEDQAFWLQPSAATQPTARLS